MNRIRVIEVGWDAPKGKYYTNPTKNCPDCGVPLSIRESGRFAVLLADCPSCFWAGEIAGERVVNINFPLDHDFYKG